MPGKEQPHFTFLTKQPSEDTCVPVSQLCSTLPQVPVSAQLDPGPRHTQIFSHLVHPRPKPFQVRVRKEGPATPARGVQ